MSNFPEIKFEGFNQRPLIPISALPYADQRDQRTRLPITVFGFHRIETPEEKLENRIDNYHLAAQTMLEAHGERSINDIIFRFIQPSFNINEIKEKSIEHLKPEKYNGDSCTCCLCLEEIPKDSEIYRLPCNHIFHAGNCIAEQNITSWIKKHGTCPYCRATTDLSESIRNDNSDPDI